MASRYNKIKEAHSKVVRKYRLLHPEKLKTAHQKWRAANPNKVKKYMYEGNTKYRNNNPIKIKARKLLQYAVKIGKIKKLHCCICHSIKAQAHHTDYNKPLEVMWLCEKHHIAWHKIFEADFEE